MSAAVLAPQSSARSPGKLTIVDPTTGTELFISPRKTPRKQEQQRARSPDDSSGSSESSSAAGAAEQEEQVRIHTQHVLESVRHASSAGARPYRVAIAKLLPMCVNAPRELMAVRPVSAPSFVQEAVHRARYSLQQDMAEGEERLICCLAAAPAARPGAGAWVDLSDWLYHIAGSLPPPPSAPHGRLLHHELDAK